MRDTQQYHKVQINELLKKKHELRQMNHRLERVQAQSSCWCSELMAQHKATLAAHTTLLTLTPFYFLVVNLDHYLLLAEFKNDYVKSTNAARFRVLHVKVYTSFHYSYLESISTNCHVDSSVTCTSKRYAIVQFVLTNTMIVLLYLKFLYILVCCF